jgi:outer membrane protein assembly factor BamB
LDTRRDGTIGTTGGTIDVSGVITYTGELRDPGSGQVFRFPGQVMKHATVGASGSTVLFAGTSGTTPTVQAYDTAVSGPGCGPGTTTACVRWEQPVDGAPTRPVLANGGGVVYVATSGGTVYAFDATTGAIAWTGSLGAAAAAAPALASGVLYVPTTTGNVVAFAADGCTGASPCTPQWWAPTGSRITEQPAVAGGVVFAGSADGTVHAFDASGCNAAPCPALWVATTDNSAISGAPAVSGGKLYVGTTNGRLFTYGLP